MGLIDQILSLENLRLAWEEVAANKGAPGIDRVSIKRWRRNWEERLVNLASAVRSNTYKASKLRRFSVPKKDGTRRWISILTVDDRVIQRATLRVIDHLFDREFMECSFGYREGRGVRDAIPMILTLRDAGNLWVVDADIDDCFNSLAHDLIFQFFKETVDDQIVMNLLSQWQRAGQSSSEKTAGICLGGVISPLLCNLVLHRMDIGLMEKGFHPIRYADDFCIFCTTKREAMAALEQTQEILRHLKLRLEPHKTKITNFDEGFDFLGIHFYRLSYSFISKEKRIEIKGQFDPGLFADYVPDGYQ